MSSLEDKTTELEMWIKTQPHMPQNMHRTLLKRYVHSVYEDIEKAKALVIFGLEIRNKSPNIFMERDPLAPAAQQVLGVCDFLPLPKLTKEGYKIFLFRLQDSDPNKYDYLETSRVFFMMYDVMLKTPEPTLDIQIPNGDIPIYDMADMKFGHVKKLIYSVMKVNMKYVQEALPTRLIKIHFINVPSIFSQIMTITRPFIRKEVEKLIVFHKPGTETLFDHVSKDVMPVEYGGNCGSIADIRTDWKARLESDRDFLMDKSNWLMTSPKTKSKDITNNITQGLDDMGFD